jgi:hypothetical protein
VALFQQVGGKRMTEGVACGLLGNPGAAAWDGLGKAANLGSCGKYSHPSRDNPIPASTRAPARNCSLAFRP